MNKYQNISIGSITCTHNTGKYFKECMDSLFAQTLKPSYITVIDDKSTDDTWNAILRYFNVESDKKTVETEKNGIKVFLHQNEVNRGPGYSRNMGLEYLIGKTNFVALLDSDDLYFPTKIQKSIDAMVKYPNVVLAYSDYEVETLSNGNIHREYKEPYSSDRLFQECIVSNNSIVYTEALKRIGGWNESPMMRAVEDYEIWGRLEELGVFIHIPENLYRYRIVGTNLTVTTPPQELAQRVYFMKQQILQRRQNVSR